MLSRRVSLFFAHPYPGSARSLISLSLLTFASTEAAAITTDFASPFTKVVTFGEVLGGQESAIGKDGNPESVAENKSEGGVR